MVPNRKIEYPKRRDSALRAERAMGVPEKAADECEQQHGRRADSHRRAQEHQLD
jgi:hypothetical protein